MMITNRSNAQKRNSSAQLPFKGVSVGPLGRAAFKSFGTIEKKPLLDLAIRDTGCFILPALALARSKNELLDSIPNSFGLLAVTVFSMLLLPPVFKRAVAKIVGTSVKTLAEELTPERMKAMSPKEKLGRLAVASGFSFPFALSFAAIPFYRNWITLKRVGLSNFDEIIGLKTKKSAKPQERSYPDELKHQLGMGNKITAAGFAAGIASMLGLAFMAKKAPDVAVSKSSKAVDTMMEHFALRGAKSSEVFGPVATLLTWLAPPSFGWYFSARSRNERLEYVVKSLNSMLWFTLFTPLITKGIFIRKFIKAGIHTGAEGIRNPIMQGYKGIIPSAETISKLTDPLLKSRGIKLYNAYNATSFLVPMTLLAVTPQLINIALTNRRFAKEYGLDKSEIPPSVQPMLQRKIMSLLPQKPKPFPNPSLPAIQLDESANRFRQALFQNTARTSVTS